MKIMQWKCFFLKHLFYKLSHIWPKIIKGIILTALIILFGFFGKDVFDKFVAKDTSFSESKQTHDELDNPTITFCFNPPLKSTAIKQYNLSPSVYMSFANIETNDYSEPISKIINKSFYLLRRDFIIETFNNSEEALEKMIFPLKQLHTG